MSEQIKPVAWFRKVKTELPGSGFHYEFATHDSTANGPEWMPLYSAETVQQLQQRNDRLLSELKQWRFFAINRLREMKSALMMADAYSVDEMHRGINRLGCQIKQLDAIIAESEKQV